MANWEATVRGVVDDVMRAQGVSGMVIAVSRGGGSPQHLIAGTDAVGTPLAADTLFPVASITKLATALAVLRLVEAGKLALDDPLALHVRDAAAAREGVTLRRLLCHTAGLPHDLSAEAAPYKPELDWPALARACLQTPRAEPAGARVNYSNLGYGLLAVTVERATGRRFVDALADLVIAPLGIEAYLGVDPPRTPARVAGGELAQHAGTDLEPYNTPFWRSLALPWGGLITTAAGAIALVRAFEGVPAVFLSPELRKEATSDQTGGLSGTMVVLRWPRCPWGLGVELRGDKSPHWAPAEAAPESFGHAGSSGCLVWSDPGSGVTWAMLSPRTFESWFFRWPEIGAAVLSASGTRR